MDFMLLVILVCYPALVWSHARLMSPPSRSSMWRLGFPTKKNFNDNALYCGGISIQWQKNGGKCGICGDPYNMPHPRENEAGGKYGRGIISKRYVSGQVIEAIVDVTTNHRGYFEFKLCPNNNPKREASQECLDKYILTEAHGTGNRYYIGDKGNGDIRVKLQLPKGLTCSQCVFQWTYVAGNNWGRCEDGESRLGCGPQETFRGCADIAIDKNPGIFNIKPNENDVESKPGALNPHKTKDRLNPKDTTTTKPIVYTYEVTKHTRQQRNWTIMHKIPDNSYHHDHSPSGHNHSHSGHDHSHSGHNQSYFGHGHTRFHHKDGNFLPPSLGQPGQKWPIADQPRQRGVSNRKFPKYDNRHFYFNHKNTSFHKFIHDMPFSTNNNNRWSVGNGQTYFKIGNRHIRKKHDAGRSSQQYPQSYFPYMPQNNGGLDENLSHGFNLGGRRYKDFWLL